VRGQALERRGAIRRRVNRLDRKFDDALGLTITIASTIGESGSGLEKVSGPPASTNGACSSRSSRSTAMREASSIRTKPEISSS